MKKLEKSLNEYISRKKSQDECSGFVDGYEKALEDSNAAGMLAMSLMMSASESSANKSWEDETKPYPKTSKEELAEKINLSKGLKKFYFGGWYCWALNQKSADKKAKKHFNL